MRAWAEQDRVSEGRPSACGGAPVEVGAQLQGVPRALSLAYPLATAPSWTSLGSPGTSQVPVG